MKNYNNKTKIKNKPMFELIILIIQRLFNNKIKNLHNNFFYIIHKFNNNKYNYP